MENFDRQFWFWIFLLRNDSCSQCDGLACKIFAIDVIRNQSSAEITLKDLHFHLLMPREYLNLQLISLWMFFLHFVIISLRKDFRTSLDTTSPECL